MAAESDNLSGAIEEHEAGLRLDQVITRRAGLSRRGAWRLITHGGVSLDGRAVDVAEKGQRVAAGQMLTLTDPEQLEQPIADPRALPPIAATGSGWLIVCKPAGRAVHPLRPGERGTILNGLVHAYPHMIGVGEGGLRSGVVHRLDLPTSGALLVTTEQASWQRLRDTISSGETTKRYHAVVHGRLTGAREETRRLLVARHRPARVRALDPAEPTQSGERTCHLRWQALDHLGPATLIEIELHTGFLHQIRVMLAAQGYPVVGDERYGPGHELDEAAGRLMLHSSEIKSDQIAGRCDWPADFTAGVNWIEG